MWTGSLRARELLDNWEAALPKFVKVFPREYERALGERHTSASFTAIRQQGPEQGSGVLTK